MAENPFNPKPPKQINPRFSLGGSANSTETEDFEPKSNAPERVRRPAPRPIGAQSTTAAPSLPAAPAPARRSPNSLFALEEDDLNLDIGVNDNETAEKEQPQKKEPTPVTPPVRAPADVVPPVFRTPAIKFEEDELSLDVGVNDAAVLTVEPTKPAAQPNEPVTETTPPTVETVKVSVPEPAVQPQEPVDSSTVEPDYDAPKRVEPVAEEPQTSVSEPVRGEVVEEPTPVVTPPVVAKPAVPSFSTAPKPERKRSVNPMFADPTPDEDEEELNLDVGVEDSEPAAKRSVNALFDFKNDKQNNRREDPDRMPAWKRTGPLIDTSDGDDFKKQKNKRERKVANTGKRGFQIQERDITLLRFLTKYQFSYVDAIARVLNSTPASINNRLRTLEEYDLVKRQVIAAGSTLWQARKSGIQLAGMSFTENKKSISFATIRHTIGLVNLAAELEREADDGKDILGLSDKFKEPFPVMNRWPGGIRMYADEADGVELTYGEMTISEREIRQGQKRYRGGRSSQEMRDLVDFSILNPEAPELEEGNEGLFVVYGTGGKTGEHVPDLVVTRPRNDDGTPNHFAVELELTAKSPADWKRILRSYREAGGMYSRIYYFTPDKPIANMIRNADEEVGLGDKLIIRKYTPKNKRQPFLG
jgi:hypothetical protein